MKPTPENLAAENDVLRAKVAELEAVHKAKPDEKVIRAKMAAGLTREQAEASLKHQNAFTARWPQRATA